jgi:hypothetical protein
MSEYIRTNFTEQAIDLFCDQMSLARPWSQASENYYLEQYPDAIKAIERELMEKGVTP